jgi:hypothetical protein
MWSQRVLSSYGGTNKMLPYSSVTPKSVYMSRRQFLAGSSAAFGFASALSFANTKLNATKSALSTREKPTPYKDVTTYNNFYEFGTGKGDPVRNAKNFRTTPWTVSIEGAVAKPQVLDLDALFKIASLEERIYAEQILQERFTLGADAPDSKEFSTCSVVFFEVGSDACIFRLQYAARARGTQRDRRSVKLPRWAVRHLFDACSCGDVEMETEEGLKPELRAQGYRLLCVDRARGPVTIEA